MSNRTPPLTPSHIRAQAFGSSPTNGRGDVLAAGIEHIARGRWVGVTYANDLKRPKGGPNAVTQDPDELARWIAAEPGCGLFVNLPKSGLVDLDLEVRRNGDGREHRYEGELARLEAELGALPPTLVYRSPGGGQHRIFRADPDLLAGISGDSHLADHVELRVGMVGNDSSLTLPPTAGRLWITAADHPIADLPAPWYERRRQTGAQGNGHRTEHAPLPEIVTEGERRDVLIAELGALRARGAPEGRLLAYAHIFAESSDPPMPLREAEYQARDVAKRYPAGQPIRVVHVPSLRSQDDDPGAWPDPMDADAFHGPLGSIARKLTPLTEADPHAILLHLLVLGGNAAGRGPHCIVGATRHGANLFVVPVGATSSGRKGTARDLAMPIFERADEQWSAERQLGGLASGEGLIHAVRDPVRVPGEGDDEPSKLIDDGVSDKRLMVVEPEFAAVLKVGRREGNTLSALLRQAYDGGRLQNATKNSPERATAHHISVIGHITPDELRRSLSASEQANGFANRFPYPLVRRARKLPRPLAIDYDALLGAEIEKVKQALKWAKMAVKPLDFDAKAGALWDDAYEHQLTKEWSGQLDALLARAAPHALRLALVYAIFDRSDAIRAEHVRAALAVWRYCEESTRIIFRAATGDPLADELHRHLLAAGSAGLTRTQIRDLTGRHRAGAELDYALGTLAANGLARQETLQTGGRSAARWIATNATDATEATEGGGS